MGSFNWRDLGRGALVGLIAGIGYLLAYKIIIALTMNLPLAASMESLGWLIAIPAPAFLLQYFSKRMKREEPIQPIEPIEPETSGSETVGEPDPAGPPDDDHPG